MQKKLRTNFPHPDRMPTVAHNIPKPGRSSTSGIKFSHHSQNRCVTNTPYECARVGLGIERMKLNTSTHESHHQIGHHHEHKQSRHSLPMFRADNHPAVKEYK